MSGPASLRGGPLHWSMGDLATRAGGRLLAGNPALPIRGVAADTRAVLPGDLFVAIRGERIDAHALLPQAFAAGAVAVLVDREAGDQYRLSEVPAGAGIVLVPSVLPALGRLAAAHLRGLHPGPRVVGITGSVGKTSTCQLVAAALGAGGPALCPEGSYNTEVTLPLVCLRATPAHRFAALELAMRGPGQIGYLAEICRPQVGVLTVIGDSHLELLGTLGAIAAAKGELLAALPSCGCAILNRDDPWQREMAALSRAAVVWYGLGAGAEVTATDLVPSAEQGYQFTVEVRGRRVATRLLLLGRHQVANALAALACADFLGVDLEAAALGLGTVLPTPGRLRLLQAGDLRILDDTFNAAPQSVVAALEALAALVPEGRRAAVLGDMLELGPASVAGHQRVGAAAAGAGLSWLVTVGPLAKDIAAGARRAGFPPGRIHGVADALEATSCLAGILSGTPRGTAVLVKGSHALGLEGVVSFLAEWARSPGQSRQGAGADGGHDA